MSPFLSAIQTWLKGKFPSGQQFPAPNNALSIRINDTQYIMFFITDSSDAMTAASSIPKFPTYPPASKRVGVMVASSEAVANDPNVQSAIASNYTADAVYLGFMNMTQVKKWPPSAP
jgi:hypothetical protein